MKYPSAYIFDLDGTLADTCRHVVDTKLEVLDIMNIPRPDAEFLSSLNGMKLEDTFAISTGIDDLAMQREAVKLYHPLFLKKSLSDSTLFPGVTMTLDTLKRRGAHIGIMSMRLTADLDTLIKAYHLDKYADAWLTEEAVGKLKPSPDIALKLMEQIGGKPETTLIVGDTVYDLEIAVNCGSPGAAVSFGAQTRRVLDTRPNIAIVDHFTEIADITLP